MKGGYPFRYIFGGIILKRKGHLFILLIITVLIVEGCSKNKRVGNVEPIHEPTQNNIGELLQNFIIRECALATGNYPK